MTISDFKNKNVTVVGLGRFGGGIGAARWLVDQGANVTISDRATKEQLAESLDQLAGLDIKFNLGGHLKEDFTQADLLVVSPAIPPEMPMLKLACENNIPITTEINLFIERCPAKIIAITGSVGKSTTTAMLGEILKQKFTTHVGGNIGKSLLMDLDKIKHDHMVVLELSSFQLEYTAQIKFRPSIALATNIVPNHLDRHGDMQNYVDAKKNIFKFQTANDVLILNAQDQALADWQNQAAAKVEFFSAEDKPSFELLIPGTHNQANAQAAWSAAKQVGVSFEQAQQGLAKFEGLKHRLQFVCQIAGIKFYNDSKCTTPEGAIVALDSFETGKAIILLGGYDKNVSFDKLARAVAKKAKCAIAFGQVADKLKLAIERANQELTPAEANSNSANFILVETLEQALNQAKSLAKAGDSILLSPACASYDQFTNYQQRGDIFCKLAAEK